MNCAAFFSSLSSVSRFPQSPSIILLPLLFLPPYLDPSCHLLEIEEKDVKAPSSSSLATLPPSPRCVYRCVFPEGLTVVFLCFVDPPTLFPRCFRCSAASLAEVLPDPWPPPLKG